MPPITPGSAFARDYVPQVDTAADAASVRSSRNATKARDLARTSTDPIKRLWATGTLASVTAATEAAQAAHQKRKGGF